jgi:hypothetical protein
LTLFMKCKIHLIILDKGAIMRSSLLVVLVVCISVSSAGFVGAAGPNAPAGISSDKIARCAVYARALVGIQNNKSAWDASADKIKSICPGTGFKCSTFNHHPEKNKCEPFILDGKGTFFEDAKYGFPTNHRP